MLSGSITAKCSPVASQCPAVRKCRLTSGCRSSFLALTVSQPSCTPQRKMRCASYQSCRVLLIQAVSMGGAVEVTGHFEHPGTDHPAGWLSLLLTCSLMFIGAYGCGMLSAWLPQQQRTSSAVTAVGAGLLLGSALCIILPEGFAAVQEAPDSMPHLTVSAALLGGFWIMLLLDSLSHWLPNFDSHLCSRSSSSLGYGSLGNDEALPCTDAQPVQDNTWTTGRPTAGQGVGSEPTPMAEHSSSSSSSSKAAQHIEPAAGAPGSLRLAHPARTQLKTGQRSTGGTTSSTAAVRVSSVPGHSEMHHTGKVSSTHTNPQHAAAGQSDTQSAVSLTSATPPDLNNSSKAFGSTYSSRQPVDDPELECGLSGRHVSLQMGSQEHQAARAAGWCSTSCEVELKRGGADHAAWWRPWLTDPSHHALLGLLVHAASDGFAVGAASLSSAPEVSLGVATAMVVHKGPVALGLTTFLKGASWTPAQVKQGLLLFASASPVAAVMTYGLLAALPGIQDNIPLLILFSGGTVLYAATMHILPGALNRGTASSSRTSTSTSSSVPHHDNQHAGSVQPSQLYYTSLGMLITLLLNAAVGSHHH